MTHIFSRVAFAAIVLTLAPALAEAKPKAKTAKTPSSGAAMAQMVSALRAQNGLGKVVNDTRLQRVAQTQANAMAAANSMSHNVAGDLGSRLAQGGVAIKSSATENIGAGQKSLQEVFGLWQASSSHRANMLNAKVTRIGVAVAHNPASSYGNYWALVLSD